MNVYATPRICYFFQLYGIVPGHRYIFYTETEYALFKHIWTEHGELYQGIVKWYDTDTFK